MKNLAILIVALLGQQIDPDFSRVVITFGNPPKIFNSFGEKNKYHELKQLIENAKSTEFRFYLKMILIDFDKYFSLDSKEKVRIKYFLKKIHDHNYNPDYKKRSSIAKEILNEYKEIITLFGDFSYFDLTISGYILTIMLDDLRWKESPHDERHKFLTFKINHEIERFSNSKWSGSPLLSKFYLIRCFDLKAKKDFTGLLKSSNTALDLLNTIAVNNGDEILIEACGYRILSLNMTGYHGETVVFFEKLSKNILENEQKLNSISCIYSSVADSYFQLGKLDLGESYQELALSKIHNFYLDLEHPEVIAEAKKLYKMLEKRGKKGEMAKIEERYNLKKHP